MLQQTISYIRSVDARRGDLDSTLAALRRLTLEEFGLLHLQFPAEDLPHLSSLLPLVTPDEVQQEWTGGAGESLLRSSLAFMTSVAASYGAVTRRSIADAKVLDFGCGWARLLRLAPYYIAPENLYGCDAWKVSLDHARAARPLAKLALSAVYPEDLPFSGVTFDVIYAFSVFTHLSARAAEAALGAFRRRISPEGLAIITIRPPEFWPFITERRNIDYSALSKVHEATGFAFVPANSQEADPAYGDTSISEGYITARFPEWEIVQMGRHTIDPYQVIVCLRPR